MTSWTMAGNADSRPNFSGLWELDLETSTLRGEPPSRILMQIEHTDPTLVQRIVVTRKDGTEVSLMFSYETTGRETKLAQIHDTARSIGRWAGSELLIESWMETKDRALHFKDYWSLSADGATLTMAHRDDDLAGQTSVLHRAHQEDGQKFHPR